MLKYLLLIIVHAVTDTSGQTTTNGVAICPEYARKPENVTFLVAGEKWCAHPFFSEYCYSCCQQTDTICCADGSCMQYDPYCRYPESCCPEPYCYEQCCTPNYGVPCGPVCAPRDSTQCCNAATGQLCAKSDTCCNDFCCPPTTHCCPSANQCLQQGETCCGTTSCKADSFCCGNMPNKCCPNGYECVAESGGCCLPGLECLGAPEKCCNNGSHCCGDHCCPDDQMCCGNSCCVSEHTCCDGKCCSSNIGCQGGGACCPQSQVCGLTCCPPGQTCCDDHHCCPAGHSCCGNLCCPSGQSCCNSDKKCYPNGITECADRCCVSGTTCVNDQFGIQCCDHQYCGSTGRCCHPGTNCNERGHCCNDNTKFCSGGSAEACFPTNAVCCGDGSACPIDHPVCVREGDNGAAVCCPPGMYSTCGGMCRPPSYHDCQCCGTSCCVAPYSCNGNSCFHDYSTGCGWWSHCNHHDEQWNDHQGAPAVGRLRPSKINHSQRFLQQVLIEAKIQKAANGTNPPLQLPPPPTHKINPASYACFQDAATMSDTCTAWDCLENIMRCGDKGPLLQQYELICHDFRRLSNLFNAEGQTFLNCTADSVTQELVNIVRHDNIKLCCASLIVWLQDKARFERWAGCGFCTVYLTNHSGFKALFDLASPGVNPLTIYSEFCHIG